MATKIEAADLIVALMYNTYTAEEVSRFQDALKFARERAGRSALNQLHIGQTVYFTGRRKRPLSGPIVKINPTRVKIQASDGMLWSVPPNLLRTTP